ncbi:MAG: PD40 domain-containing protein, partial [Sphingobacteriaceae bacterium]|nr:PD40 domain-containing protein [Cytophagaceae bacterium]
MTTLLPASQRNWGMENPRSFPASSSPGLRWASKVLGVSSEAIRPDQSPEYRAIQALGTPNHLPAQGPTACAWQPSTADSGEEWIQVAFDTLMPIRQVLVAESAGAGSVYRVYLYDPQGGEHLVFDSLYAVKGDSHLFQLTLKTPTPFAVASVKIVLNTLRRPGFSQLDAIGISASTTPVEPGLNVTPLAPKPDKVVKENLGTGVNSKSKELNPIITPDGKTLYFTRWGHPDNQGNEVTELINGRNVRQKKQDIWVSEFQNNSWQPARNLGAPLNNDDHNAVCSVSADGQLLLLNQYQSDGRMTEGLSQSRRTKTGWTFPNSVSIKNYTLRGAYSEFALSPDRRFLVMAVQLKGTFGRKDLYVSHRLSDDSWSEPVNLGPTVNTAEDETSPFLAADGKTLYFSTEGWPGLGSNDIFVIRRLDDTWTHWSSPENLGPGINTPQWDGYFSIPASGEWAYLCSENGSLGKEDIFRLRMYEAIKPEPVAIVSGSVLNFIDRKPLKAEVVTSVLSGVLDPSDSLRTEYNPETGEYKLVLPLQK